MTVRPTASASAIAQVAEALEALPDTWVMCRDLRHAWSVDEDFHVLQRKGSQIQEVGRVLVCLRCSTKRYETYVPTRRWGLERVRSRYDYPENYLIRNVPDGVKPQSIIQAENYRRSLAKISMLQTQVDHEVH